jgi:hypothetical protein
MTAVAAAMVLAVSALPGQATFAKLYTLNIAPATGVSSGAQDATFTATYKGKSLFIAGSSNLTAPSGFGDVKYVSKSGSGEVTVDATGTILQIRKMRLGLGSTFTVTFTADVPSVACGGSQTFPWTVATKTKSDFSGSADWNTTSPSSLTTQVSGGECAPATVNVTKYDDTNGNGTRDEGEPGIEGWQFTADGGGDHATDETGQVSIPVAPNAAHTICEVEQEGWTNTEGPVCRDVTAEEATPGASIDLVFGNAKDVTITVQAFGDDNLNGVLDPGEMPLAGFGFDLKSFDGSEILGTDVTDASGFASFTAPAGVGYQVCQNATVPPGDLWTPTRPGGACQTITAAEATSGSEFGADAPFAFGNSPGTLGCDTENSEMELTGEPGAGLALEGARINDLNSETCGPLLPYEFSPNPEGGGFVFVKDSSQPNAQFIVTQTYVTDILSGGAVAGTSIAGHVVEISYLADITEEEGYHPVPGCDEVQFDGSGNVIGATLPTGEIDNPFDDSWCIAALDVAFGFDVTTGEPAPGMVSIITTLFGLGDPATRTRPI